MGSAHSTEGKGRKESLVLVSSRWGYYRENKSIQDNKKDIVPIWASAFTRRVLGCANLVTGSRRRLATRFKLRSQSQNLIRATTVKYQFHLPPDYSSLLHFPRSRVVQISAVIQEHSSGTAHL